MQKLDVFLKGHMLGLVSSMNETLQDVHGKKTTIAKRQIVRSLGALVRLIGSPISKVAPQVSVQDGIHLSKHDSIFFPDHGDIANYFTCQRIG